jgi:hypothetical protein
MQGPTQGGGFLAAVLQTPKTEIKKDKFCRHDESFACCTAQPISEVLRALPLSRYQKFCVLYRSADIRSFACCTAQPISEVLRAVPLSRYEPLRSSDNWYIRILKNIVMKFKKKHAQEG